MEVIIKRFYIKELRFVPKYILEKTDEVIDILRKAESLEKSGLDYIKMKSQLKNESYYRIRMGDWRLGVEYVQPTIIAITILTRGEIYKHFPPNN